MHKYDYECRCESCQAENKRIREGMRKDWIKTQEKVLVILKKKFIAA